MLNRSWTGPAIRASLVASAIVLGVLLIWISLPLIYPFLIGGLIAAVIEPAVVWMEKRLRAPRWLGVTVILFLVVGLILTLLIFLVAEIVVELAHLAESLPLLLNKVGQIMIDAFTENTDLRTIIDTVQTYLEKNPQHQQRISASIQSNIDLIANKGTEGITGILAAIGRFISDLPYLLTVLVFIMLAAFFIGVDLPRLKRNAGEWVPARIRDTAGHVALDLKRALFGFLRAQLTLVSISAVIMFAGLMILNVQYAFTVALFIGLVDLLPYLGVGAVLVPWIIYSFLTGSIHLATGLTIIYGVILVVRQFLEPKLVASNVGLDPLFTLFALFVGLKLFGFVGLILGPVTAVILLALHRSHVFRDVWNYIWGIRSHEI
ncbi:sporulation integral membrane protein YtvI [Staphylospora marina]|uniref:sporulation integral membrane protein YtvI n=1 Tax=Staphylospora marina TaxID=2490858 RepID=UPI000F5BC636|nr:sporulation integral membrane protein YtvI [Staphylospora marina]